MNIDSSWMSNATIKVTPEQMAAKAANVKGKINKIRTSFASMEQQIKTTNNYWKGEANNVYRNKYNEYKTRTDEMISRLEEHVKDLNTMAGVYETAEREAVKVAESLPVDVIF